MSGNRRRCLSQQQQQPQQEQPSTRRPSGAIPISLQPRSQQPPQKQQQQLQLQHQLHQQMAESAHQLQRRRRALEATREKLQRDLQDRRRALEGAFRWLEDVLAAQRRERLSEVEQVERSCRRILDRRIGELQATRDALIAGLSDDARPSDADLVRLLEAAISALDLGGESGFEAADASDECSAAVAAVEQLRLSQHRWQVDFEAWLRAMPQGPANPSGTLLSVSKRAAGLQPANSAGSEYYSVPASDAASDGLVSPGLAASAATSAAHPAVHVCASWPALRQPTVPPSALTSPSAAAEQAEQQPRYWSPSESTSSRRGFFDQPSQEYSLKHPQLPQHLPQQQQQQQQQRAQQSHQIATSGCPVSIAFGGPPENLIYVVEEFEDDRLNQVNIYSASGRKIDQVSFNLGQDVNPYRLTWCPQSQRLLLLSYSGRHCTRPFLVDRRGRPVEPFTSATRTLNLASMEPLDVVAADPPGLAFLCCPSKGILLMDLCGRQLGCNQLGLGAPVAAGWSGSTQQLAVLHSKAQPAFRLSLFSLVDGLSLRLSATCAVDFESIDPPLVIWDGPRVLVVKVINEGGGGCLDVYSAEPGCPLVLDATRLLWQGGDRRNPIHCCLSMHDGQRTLCICDRNHPTVLTCLV